MAENDINETPEKNLGFKNDKISIEININDKGGKDKPQINTSGTSKTAEKARDVIDNIKVKEKEIDLLEVSGNVAKSVKKGSSVLFSWLWSIIKLVSILLYRLILFVLNSWKFVLIVAIIGIGTTFYLYHNSRPYYNSDGYGITRITSSQEIIQIINSVSIPNDSLNITLKNDLNLRPEVYNNIKSLQASWLIDENGDGIADLVDYDNDYVLDKENDSIATRMTDRFNLRLQVWDQSITNEVQIALIKFLYNHPFIRNLNSSRLNTIDGMISVYNQQANVLDSLQYYEYFVENQKLRSNDGNFNGLKFGDFEIKGNLEQRDKRLYHEEIIKLKENAIESTSSLIYNKEPILFVGNMNNTNNRVNSISFYAKKVAKVLLPFALLFFAILKRKEFEKIFYLKDLFEDKNQ